MDAAGTCFRARGFHSASMAQIARTASMSVGHIYRYFTGKDAIIEAIVERDLQRRDAFIAELEHADPSRIVDLIVAQVADLLVAPDEGDRAALTVEIAAEAGRNPRVAAALRQSHERSLAQLKTVLMRAASGSTPSQLDARTEVLAMLFDGLALRLIKQPDVDRGELTDAMRMALTALVTP